MSATDQDTAAPPRPGLRPNDTRLPPMPADGFRNYWYPVMSAWQIRRKPVVKKLLGQEVAFFRDKGGVYAIQNDCPHRGASLAIGRRLAPGTVSCRYHGFTFDLANGDCVAALTEGPDSPITSRLKARTYPVEQRFGILWVYMGEGTPPPLEDDLPEDMLRPNVRVVSRMSVWNTNWRTSVDNGVDAAHVPFLHRNHPHVRFLRLPSFFDVSYERDGAWVKMKQTNVRWQAEFPRIGVWPRDLRFRKPAFPVGMAARLPGVVRISYRRFAHIRWAVPIDENSTWTVQCLVKQASGLTALVFYAYYWLWERWMLHISFQRQDHQVLATIERLAPEQLSQSDKSIIAWRRLAKEARGPQRLEGSVTVPMPTHRESANGCGASSIARS